MGAQQTRPCLPPHCLAPHYCLLPSLVACCPAPTAGKLQALIGSLCLPGLWLYDEQIKACPDNLCVWTGNGILGAGMVGRSGFTEMHDGVK